MYNINLNPVPPVLPVAETIRLKPWFSSDLLAQGLEIVRKGELTNFFYFRNGAGALINDKVPVTLLFEHNRKLRQGFTIRYEQCGLCRLDTRRKRCPHLAALTLLSLSQPTDERKCFPLPLLFESSGWNTIGTFLHNVIPLKSFDINTHPETSTLTLSHRSEDWDVEIILPDVYRHEVEIFDQAKLKGKTGAVHQALSSLRTTLSSFTKTTNELSLEKMGAIGKAWHRDNSFWMWLASHFHMLYEKRLPTIIRHPASGLFRSLLRQRQKVGSSPEWVASC